MSIDPEASVFEHALRADLPSAEAEQRLRRRLLAAGLAVGNGIAASTAAAAGTATTSVTTGGLVANVVGLSWGVKLGFAAAVAIPTLGLLLEAGEPVPRAMPSVVSAAAQPRSAVAERAPFAKQLADQPPEPGVDAPSRSAQRIAKSAAPPRELPLGDPPPALAAPSFEPAPSQREFAATPVAPVAAPVAAPQSKSSLAEETRLLDSAFAELTAGNRARAAQLIAEHEARYPEGLLSRERERAKLRLSELARGN